MDCRFLLQGIFPTQESNPFPSLQADSFPPEPPGKLVAWLKEGVKDDYQDTAELYTHTLYIYTHIVHIMIVHVAHFLVSNSNH